MKRICPQCGAAMRRKESRTEVIEFGGESTRVTGLSGWFCTACDEAIFDDDSARRYGEAGDALIAQARQRRQAEIRRIRKKLGLTQIEAGKVVGVGKVAFSRYERGETQAPEPLVKLLRLVDRHPELLGEIQSD
jgi:HTH-type transcriptional regulator/antitoxin MqsA